MDGRGLAPHPTKQPPLRFLFPYTIGFTPMVTEVFTSPLHPYFPLLFTPQDITPARLNDG